MTQHTKGPWMTKATASIGPQYVIYPESDGPCIAIVYDHGDAYANAALISAAPELLEALKRLVQEQKKFFDSTTGTYHYNNDTVSAIAAINKAEGRD